MPEIKVDQPEQTEPQETEPHGPWHGKSEIMENAVVQALDLDKDEASKYKDKINTILDYVKGELKTLSPTNVKWAIRNIELKLGSPPLSENRISQVSRYAYLHQEKQKINDEMQQLNPFEEE